VLDVALELRGARPDAPPRTAGATAPAAPAPASAPGETLEAMERRHVLETLARTGWVIEGARGAAASLGMSASTLRSRMKRLGVRRPAGR
jgi:formate hydrogenlyase transcriptional activator